MEGSEALEKSHGRPSFRCPHPHRADGPDLCTPASASHWVHPVLREEVGHWVGKLSSLGVIPEEGGEPAILLAAGAEPLS